MRRAVAVFFRWIGATAFWFVVVSLLWTALLGLVDPPVTWVMAQQAREQERFRRIQVDMSEIARPMPLSVIASEDQRFMTHNGFSWEAMRKAFERNKKAKRIKGGSTISQQTAKNVFLWPGRTYLRKGLEAWFTVLIELIWGKRRIMEVYLNVVETGIGIYGAEAAARHWFGKPAAKLTGIEAARLAAILPSPLRWQPLRSDRHVVRRGNVIANRVEQLGPLLDCVK